MIKKLPKPKVVKSKFILGKDKSLNTIIPAIPNSKLVLPQIEHDKLFLALSNPLDLRTDYEIALEEKIEFTALKEMKSNPVFMSKVNQRFRQLMGNVQVDLIKSLIRDALSGNRSAVASAKLLLQSMGLVTEGNTIVNFNGSTTTSSNSADYAAKLSDLEVDAEISRLSLEITPEDLMYQDGKFIEVNPTYTEQQLEDQWKEIKNESNR